MTGRAAVGGRIPQDQGLPQLRRLLDTEEMAAVLERSLAPGTAVSGVRVLYLRYKPGTRLIVRYGVTIGDAVFDATALAEPAADLAGWATDPEHVALARKADGRTPAQAPLSFDEEVGALIQWLPLDLTLPAIAEPPRELRALLAAAGVEIAADGDPPTVLAYKARRRAVLRFDGHVVKVYAGAADFENAVVGLGAARHLTALDVPRAEAVIPKHRLTCQTLLAGKPPVGHHEAAEAAGSALAALHQAPRSGLRLFPPDRQLAAAASSARSAVAVVPELASRLGRLVDELAAAEPERLTLAAAHGDFHANQVLDRNGGLAVIDFDEICAAPAALDFSSYVAHLVTGVPGELRTAADALDDLVEGYGSRPDALGWYVSTSIVRRSPFPFRFQDDGWPERIEQMVGDAEEALAL